MAVGLKIWNSEGEIVLESGQPVFQLLAKRIWTPLTGPIGFSTPYSHSTRWGPIVKDFSSSLIFVKPPAGGVVSGVANGSGSFDRGAYSNVSSFEYAEVVLGYDVEPATGYGLNIWDDLGRCTFSSRLPLLKASGTIETTLRNNQNTGGGWSTANTFYNLSLPVDVEWACMTRPGAGVYRSGASSGINNWTYSQGFSRDAATGLWTVRPVGMAASSTSVGVGTSTWSLNPIAAIFAEID